MTGKKIMLNQPQIKEGIVITKKELQDKIICIQLNGFLDTYNSTYVQQELTKIIETDNYNRVILDCSQLSYLSSTGLGTLTVIFKKVKTNGGNLVLIDVQKKVLEILQLLGFVQFFNIKPTLDEAIEFLQKNLKDDEFENAKFSKCPICSAHLKISKAGRYKCGKCKAILNIDRDGIITLG